jgi:hypothetical protein
LPAHGNCGEQRGDGDDGGVRQSERAGLAELLLGQAAEVLQGLPEAAAGEDR